MIKTTSETFQTIESAAHTGAFGDNQLVIPTDAQTIAGNYKLGRVNIHGMTIAIEQPRHSYRTGIDKKTGKRWTSRLAAHYGYFSGTKGADGDPIDCFLGFYHQSEYAYVINQYVKGQWDEHKVMLFFPDESSAKLAYQQSYDKGWNGLHSVTKASISQLKWWLKYGNHKKPLLPNHLPYEGLETMTQRVTWDSAQNPYDMTLDKLLYEIRRADSGENLIFDSVTMADILEEAESVLIFDALITPYAKLQRKMEVLKTVMERTGGTINPEAVQISEPFKSGGVLQVAVIFELSDGQTVSIFFHNPDVDPKKILPSDELISWKWLLNKKDITVVVAPEKGLDLNVKVVAERIIKIAEKNSPAFIKANGKRAEKLAVIEAIKDEIPVLEKELADVQHELEVAKVENESANLRSTPEHRREFGVQQALSMLGWKELNSFWSIVLPDSTGYETRYATELEDGEWITDCPEGEVSRLNDGGSYVEMADAINSSVRLFVGNKDKAVVEPIVDLDPIIDWTKAENLDTTESIRALGVAEINEIGGENVYVLKDGKPYYFKPVSTSGYAVGEHDFSNDNAYGGDELMPDTTIEPELTTTEIETNEQTNEQTEVTQEDETAGKEDNGTTGIEGDQTKNDDSVNQGSINTLQAIVDGTHDDMDLTELLDMIDKAATALIDAGLGEENDSLIGESATKWAKLDELKNG